MADCNLATLQASACSNGFAPLSDGDKMAVLLQLLCDISEAHTTSNVQGRYGDYSGGQPTWTPTSDVGVAFDTSTGPVTEWWYYDGAWH